MGDFSMNRSHRVRLSRFLKGKNVLLRGVSALKYLELFVEDHFTFDVQTERLQVYATAPVADKNYEALVVADFSHLQVDEDGEVLCCTLGQVVEDLLEEGNPKHLEILIEALANYAEEGGNFHEIQVKEKHQERFDGLKRKALAFYD